MDFADRGGENLTPTVGNITNIVIDVSRAILLNAPMHTLKKIKEGMLQVKGSERAWSS